MIHAGSTTPATAIIPPIAATALTATNAMAIYTDTTRASAITAINTIVMGNSTNTTGAVFITGTAITKAANTNATRVSRGDGRFLKVIVTGSANTVVPTVPIAMVDTDVHTALAAAGSVAPMGSAAAGGTETRRFRARAF